MCLLQEFFKIVLSLPSVRANVTKMNFLGKFVLTFSQNSCLLLREGSIRDHDAERYKAPDKENKGSHHPQGFLDSGIKLSEIHDS